MTEPPESDWYNISFSFKIVGAEVQLSDADSRTLLRGLAQTVGVLLLPDSDYKGVKVYAGDFKIANAELFTDEMLNRILDEWDKGDEP